MPEALAASAGSPDSGEGSGSGTATTVSAGGGGFGDVGDGNGDGGGDKTGKGPGLGGPAGKSGSLAPGLEIASEVKARHEHDLLAIGGVVGTGVSRDEEGEPVIEVYVKRATVDARRPIPAQLEGIPVRVVVTGPVTAY